MLTCLHRQVQTLSGELDRYRAGGSSAQRSFEELKAEKEAEYAEQRRALEEMSKRCQMVEMENTRLKAELDASKSQLHQKSAEALVKSDRIAELEAELTAEKDTVCSLRIAMKSTNLEARHSDHRAVRTAQQSHDEAEAKMRKAMRHCQELEARVATLEEEALTAQHRIADKNAAIERLHDKASDASAREHALASELQDLRAKLGDTEGRANQMNELMSQARTERIAALKKKDEVISRLRAVRDQGNQSVSLCRKALGEAIHARICHEQLSKPTKAPRPPRSRPGNKTARPSSSSRKVTSSNAKSVEILAVMMKIREKAAKHKQENLSVLRTFKRFDVDNCGLIDELQFREGLRRMGVLDHLSEDEYATLVTNFDQDGQCAYKDFCQAFLQQLPTTTLTQRRTQRRPKTARPSRSQSQEITRKGGNLDSGRTAESLEASALSEWSHAETVAEAGDWATANFDIGFPVAQS